MRLDTFDKSLSDIYVQLLEHSGHEELGLALLLSYLIEDGVVECISVLQEVTKRWHHLNQIVREKVLNYWSEEYLMRQ